MAGELARQGDRAERHRAISRGHPVEPDAAGRAFPTGGAAADRVGSRVQCAGRRRIQGRASGESVRRAVLAPIGGIMTAKGDLKAAEEDYRKALALQPKDSDAKTGLAIVMISHQSDGRSHPLLESAVKDDPTNIVAHYRLSGLYRRAGTDGGCRTRDGCIPSLPGSEGQTGQGVQTTWRASQAE